MIWSGCTIIKVNACWIRRIRSLNCSISIIILIVIGKLGTRLVRQWRWRWWRGRQRWWLLLLKDDNDDTDDDDLKQGPPWLSGDANTSGCSLLWNAWRLQGTSHRDDAFAYYYSTGITTSKCCCCSLAANNAAAITVRSCIFFFVSQRLPTCVFLTRKKIWI